jgi:predicted nucleic acid-binding protein
VLQYRRLSARDAIHVAIAEQYGIAEILSFDAGLDSMPGIRRLS